MEPGEALSAAAQVAATLAGFAGVVVVFRKESVHASKAIHKLRLASGSWANKAKAPSRDGPYRNTRSDLGKMNLQLIANKENQDRAQRGKNEARRMISFVFRPQKHVSDGAADDRSDDAEHDRPENRHVRVHHRFRDNPCEQPNKNIPD